MKNFFLASFSLFLVSAPALAQDPFIQDEEPVQQMAQDPYAPQPQQQEQVFEDPEFQSQQQQEPVYEEAEVARGARQASVYLTLPIYLSEGGGWDPGFGIGIGGRFGWEFGMIVPEIHVGIQTSISGLEGYSRVSNIFFSLGARLQILNPSRFIPFVSLAIRGNYWSVIEDAAAGGFGVAEAFHPAAMGGVGVAIEVTRTFGIEAAVDFVANISLRDGAVTAPGGVVEDFFLGAQNQYQLTPRIGGTLYF